MDQARHAVGAARTEYIPDVAVFVRQSYQDAVAYVPTNSFSAGVQAKWNVLDFGRRSAQVDQRPATLRLAEQNLAHVRDQVALEVERAYRNAVRADQLVVVARQATAARQDAERLTVGSGGGGTGALRCGSGGGGPTGGGGKRVTRGGVGRASGTC